MLWRFFSYSMARLRSRGSHQPIFAAKSFGKIYLLHEFFYCLLCYLPCFFCCILHQGTNFFLTHEFFDYFLCYLPCFFCCILYKGVQHYTARRSEAWRSPLVSISSQYLVTSTFSQFFTVINLQMGILSSQQRNNTVHVEGNPESNPSYIPSEVPLFLSLLIL
jgi:hypothetical protein